MCVQERMKNGIRDHVTETEATYSWKLEQVKICHQTLVSKKNIRKFSYMKITYGNIILRTSLGAKEQNCNETELLNKIFLHKLRCTNILTRNSLTLKCRTFLNSAFKC